MQVFFAFLCSLIMSIPLSFFLQRAAYSRPMSAHPHTSDSSSSRGKGRCQLCLLRHAIEHAPGYDLAARDFEACAHRNVAAEAERAPWRTQCGRDQPLDWHDANGAIAAVEDLRGSLRRQEMVARMRLDEATRLVAIRSRREVMLKASRERAQRNHQTEFALRSVDPAFLYRIQSQASSPNNDVADGEGAGESHRKPRPWSAKSTSTNVHPISTSVHPTSTAVATATPPGIPMFNGWARRQSMQSLTLTESMRLGVPSPRPTSVMGHLALAERLGAAQVSLSAADQRRAMPLPSPVVVMSPRIAGPVADAHLHPTAPRRVDKSGPPTSFARHSKRPATASAV
jgi:hypothetical protein